MISIYYTVLYLVVINTFILFIGVNYKLGKIICKALSKILAIRSQIAKVT